MQLKLPRHTLYIAFVQGPSFLNASEDGSLLDLPPGCRLAGQVVGSCCSVRQKDGLELDFLLVSSFSHSVAKIKRNAGDFRILLYLCPRLDKSRGVTARLGGPGAAFRKHSRKQDRSRSLSLSSPALFIFATPIAESGTNGSGAPHPQEEVFRMTNSLRPHRPSRRNALSLSVFPK